MRHYSKEASLIDSALIKSLKGGDERAFKLVYKKSIAYVYSIVKRYLYNEEEYKDVIQEIFARVFLSIDTFDPGKGEFRFWLRRIAINQCIQVYRRQKKDFNTVDIENAADISAEMEDEALALSKEEIVALLNKMPDGYREVFMLVIIDEYSHKEVGEKLGISPETSRSQLHRAKGWLKNNLSTKTLKELADGI